MTLSSYLLLIAIILGLFALLDWGIHRLTRNRPKPPETVVRLPRYSVVFGILLTVFSLFALLWVPRKTQMALWMGCWVVLAMGLFLLVNYFWTGIYYDDTGFTYRSFPGRARHYRYDQITGQRSFLARSGWNSILYLGQEEVQLYAVMQGLGPFLSKAFFAWCRAKNLDPDTQDTDPPALRYFPEPEE